MPDSASFIGFVIASLVVLLLPGPGVLYVIARSLGQGQRAGLVSVLGLSAGALVHVVAAAIGLSAVLLASATAFGVIKTLGAAYLIFLGVRALLAREPITGADVPEPRMMRRLFTDGVVVSVLNPKIAVFFLAFLPQFVDPARGSVSQQVLLLGLVYVALAVLTDGAYALLASRLRHWLRGQVLQRALTRYLSGLVYLGLGVGTALAERR